MIKKLFTCLPCLALGACAVNYPDLYTAPKPVAAPAADQNLVGILAKAVELQGKYASGYKESAQNEDIARLPIIGAAGLAALVLLNDKANAAKDAAKIGIGVGTYSAGVSALTAEGLPEIYIAGHGALTCVIFEGPRFVSTQGQSSHDEFTAEVAKHAIAMRALEATFGITPSGTVSDAEKGMLETARNLAKETLTQARTIEASALTQKGAFGNASPVFGGAVASISARVASKGRVRPDVDFATLRDSFKAAPPETDEQDVTALFNSKGSAGLIGAAATAPTADELIRLTILLTQYLVTEGSRLRATTPDYSGALARVSKCPESVD